MVATFSEDEFHACNLEFLLTFGPD